MATISSARLQRSSCQPIVEIPKLRIPEAVVNQISEGAVWILAASIKNGKAGI
jgi:hypothetical protein